MAATMPTKTNAPAVTTPYSSTIAVSFSVAFLLMISLPSLPSVSRVEQVSGQTPFAGGGLDGRYRARRDI